MKSEGAALLLLEYGIQVDIPEEDVAANGDCNNTSFALSISPTNYIEEGLSLRATTVLFWREKLQSSVLPDNVLVNSGIPSLGLLLDELAIPQHWDFQGYDLATNLYAGASGYSVLLVDLNSNLVFPIYPDGIIREAGMNLKYDSLKTAVIVKYRDHYEALVNNDGVRAVLLSLRHQFEQEANLPPHELPRVDPTDEAATEVEMKLPREGEVKKSRDEKEKQSKEEEKQSMDEKINKVTERVDGDHIELEAVEIDALSLAGSQMKKELKIRYQKLIVEKPDFSSKISEEGWKSRSPWDLLGDVSRLEHQVGVAKIVAEFESVHPWTIGGFNGLRPVKASGGRASYTLRTPPPPLSVVLRQNCKPAGFFKEAWISPAKSSKNKIKAYEKAKVKAKKQ